MMRRCDNLREAIFEAGGRLEALSDPDRRHLEGCASCASLAEQERLLGSLLEGAVPARDVGLEQQILAAVTKRRAYRRFKAFLPVVASFMVALLGAGLLGGVPGASLVTLVPGWSLQSWLGLVGRLGDWGVALTVMARCGGVVLPSALLAAAAAVALTGFGGLTAAAVRWRRNPPW